MLKKIVLGLLVLLVVAFLAIFIYMHSTKPVYDGTIDISGMQEEVDVHYDDYGVPHIYASSDVDAYRALGYVHAQDRLFQMEMIRRLSSGRLSEILGADMIDADKYFRTLGIRQRAEQTAIWAQEQGTDTMHRQVAAYLDGINQFIADGKTPIEYKLIGIPKEEFTEADIYTILGYMGLGFTLAIKEEPIINKIYEKLGADYLADWTFQQAYIASQDSSIKDGLSYVDDLFIENTQDILDQVGMPIWEGSNGWVVAPEKSKSGKVIFANDTHIGISQPAVWYEAHINYPGFEFYGDFLAGVPYAVIGHNRSISYGLTIFPFDVVDMYRERSNPANPNQVWVDDHWEDLVITQEVIKVKDGEDVTIDRKVSRHGPVINQAVDKINEEYQEPITLWWNYLKRPTQALIALYEMNSAENMEQTKLAVSKIDFIGLNVLYGDIEGNIALWGAGKIPKRPKHVLSKIFLDGASGKDEHLGYYDFDENPHWENPSSGYVASANNDPGIFEGNYFQGYYCPDTRYGRIKDLLEGQEKWSQEEMKQIQLDVKSNYHQRISYTISKSLVGIALADTTTIESKMIKTLGAWDGSYTLESIAPTIYTKLVYHTMRLCMADEMGIDDFSTIQASYLYKESVLGLLENDKSIWWDDIRTLDSIELRVDFIKEALKITKVELVNQLGPDINDWTWDKVHTIEHVHPIGRKKPFEKLFNVGPFPITAGNDVPNKMMYTPDSTGLYKTYSSPALRILLDFENVEGSESILPTGQSGNPMSPHYADQAEMFNNGVYRAQLMNHEVIKKKSRKLILRSKD